ncbi:MAG TPA: lysophospholipid acyltransferase family protein [Candidatus Nanopelagicales bacterium]|jgi:1-acyl-sn-glycerol-3-phosphate acyltransferase
MGAYDTLRAEGRELYPGVRIGRPGRSRAYWPSIAIMRVLRARWKVDIQGAEHVARGAGIFVANHLTAMDPVMVVISGWWRVTAFAKVEVFENRGAIFFRLMGQIPLRRGDSDSTDWAMRMAAGTLADGAKIGLYPEGKRSPDPTKLHRLHKRILVPMLQAHPDVPVYAVTTRYTARPRRRTSVQVRISPPLALDTATMDPQQLTTVIRDALLELGGQTYVDVYARDAVRERR